MGRSETINHEALIDLARAGSVRSLKAVQSGNGRYALVVQIGTKERALRSQRGGLRTWASLDTLARYTREQIGISRLIVEGA